MRHVSRYAVRVLVLTVALTAVAGSAGANGAGLTAARLEGQPMKFAMSSPAFRSYGEIPSRYTCDGEDVSPPLKWSGIPAGTRSLALIMEDPDAPDPAHPTMIWIHWVLYNIPPGTDGLPEDAHGADLPHGTREGLNDWKRRGYGGPCPPIGRHRYFAKLYALDSVLPDLVPPTKAVLEKAMQGHILAQQELVGTYQRRR